MFAGVRSFFGGSTTQTQTVVEEKEEKKDIQDKDALGFDLARATMVHQVDADIHYADGVQVTREDIEGVPSAFLLHNVLTPEECQTYIDNAERLGFTDAPLTVGQDRYEMAKDVRDNLRVMWQATPRMLIPIWERVRDLIPPVLNDMHNSWHLIRDNALNERFRFYRYDTEQVFKPHFDGCYIRPTGEQSHYTFIIYLNDGFKGGETTFFPGDMGGLYSRRKNKREVRVNPRRGTALVFRHTGGDSPLHEGSQHFSPGMQKYVLRSDIMFEKRV